jgi:hypothetical protein
MSDLRKFRTALKKAGKKTTLSHVDIKQLTVSLQKDSDRTVGIVLSTIVEDSLREILIKNMRKLNTEEMSRLFSFEGIAGTFSAKICVAFAFDLIGPDTRDDLDAIREIRNQFAHSTQLISFKNEHVANVCKSLNIIVRSDKMLGSFASKSNANGRSYFIRAAGGIMVNLVNAERMPQSRPALLP